MLKKKFLTIKSPFPEGSVRAGESALQAQSAQKVLETLLPENFFENLESSSSSYMKQEQKDLFDSHLPFVSWSLSGKSPSHLTLFFICPYTPIETLNFVHSIAGHCLIPGKVLKVCAHSALEFVTPDLSNERYIYGEVTLEIEFSRDIEKVKRNLPFLAAELRYGLSNRYKSHHMLEKKGALSPEKLDLIHRDLTNLSKRYPQVFNSDLFSLFYRFLACTPTGFREVRRARHISKILALLHLKGRSIRQATSHLSQPKHVQIKLFPASLYFPFGRRPTLGVVVSLSLLKDRQFFEESLLADAIQTIIPGASPVKNSYFSIEGMRSIGAYIEIEMRDGSKITKEKRDRLKQLLPNEIKGHIEELIHPIFMPRNDEEVYQNVIKLSGMLTQPSAPARILITYDQQLDEHLTFTAICVRLIRLDEPPLSQTLGHIQSFSEVSFDQVKVIGKLDDSLVKEANIFRLKLPKKKFFRKDGLVDLRKAKIAIFKEIGRDLPGAIDVQAELLERQEHLLSELKREVLGASKHQEYILEGLFYSLTPISALKSFSSVALKELFSLLIESIERSSIHQISDNLFMQCDDLCEYAIITADDLAAKEEIDLHISGLNFPQEQLISSHICIHGTYFFAYACKVKENGGDNFTKALQSSAKQLQAKVQNDQVLNLPMPVTSSIVPDPKMGYDHESGMVMQFLFEGLMTIDEKGSIAYATAERVELSKDRTTYRFTLREAKWSNGDPVIAQDFEYAWKRMIDPNFNTIYSYLFFIIEHAKDAHEKKCSLDKVGVHAEDEKTLVVRLARPSPYFLELTAQWPLFPVNSKTILDPGWSNVPREPHVANGPFKLVSFKHSEELVLKKNPFYWDRDKVRLEQINFHLTDGIQTEMQLFENGEIDWAGSFRFPLPVEVQKNYEKKGLLSTSHAASTYNYFFNVMSFPFTNKKMRQAFGLAISRKELIDRVFQGKEVPTTSPFPPKLALTQTPHFKDGDVEGARILFNEALKELGIGKKQLPPIVISHLDKSRKQIAKCIQEQWVRAFDIEIQLEELEWGAYFNKTTHHNFHVCGYMWYMCYNDPAEFLEYFKYGTTKLNCTHWEHPEYIELLDKASAEYNITQRRKKLLKVEKLLIDEMPIIPLYANTNTFLKKDYVQGVTISQLGDVNFKTAYIDKTHTDSKGKK